MNKSGFKYKIFKIYTGDYAEEGYDQGFKDKVRRKPRQGWGVFKSLHPVNYFWKFPNAIDSYNQNYKKGYLDQQRVENEVYRKKETTNQNGGVTMSIGYDSYQNQLRLMENGRDNLQSLRRQLKAISEKYLAQINAAEAGGYMSDMIEPLRKKYSYFEQLIVALSRLIERHDAIISEHQNRIRHLMNQAGE